MMNKIITIIDTIVISTFLVFSFSFYILTKDPKYHYPCNEGNETVNLGIRASLTSAFFGFLILTIDLVLKICRSLKASLALQFLIYVFAHFLFETTFLIRNATKIEKCGALTQFLTKYLQLFDLAHNYMFERWIFIDFVLFCKSLIEVYVGKINIY